MAGNTTIEFSGKGKPGNLLDPHNWIGGVVPWHRRFSARYHQRRRNLQRQQSDAARYPAGDMFAIDQTTADAVITLQHT
jgi:hypothetical protein